MFCIKIADLVISIDNKYRYVESLCKDYICDGLDFDFKVIVSDEEIDHERNSTASELADDYIESICIYRNIAKQLPNYNAFIMHAAAIEYKGNAFCFTAKSGTGKTTHIKLWRSLFGKEIGIINGDKPIIRLINEKFYVYGSPWSGKECFNRNARAIIKSICFIHQSKNNSINQLDMHNALKLIIPQVFINSDSHLSIKTIELVGKMLTTVDSWDLHCDISKEAAITSFNALTKGL